MRGPLEQQVGNERIRQARVTFRDGTEVSLRDVTVHADSVIGFADDGRERSAIPFIDVASIEQREVSVPRTGALLVVTAAVAYVTFVLSALSQLGPNYSAVPSPAPNR